MSLKKDFFNTIHNFRSKAIILLYHRVGELISDPQSLNVTEYNFEEQLIYLKQNYCIISLDDLISDIKNKRVRNRSVVITFDDGYQDNAINAFPILKRHNIPATFFITSGLLDSKNEYWWDELERLLVDNFNPRKELKINITGKQYCYQLDTNEAAYAAYNEIHPLIKYLPEAERNVVLSQLLEWSELPAVGRKSNLSMTTNDLLTVSGSNLITIGAHTISHPCLKCEDLYEQNRQISISKNRLELLTGKVINIFSYPFGGKNDYNDKTINIVKQAGFIAATANIPGEVTSSSDLYQLPRRIVRNWDTCRFAVEMNNFFSPHKDLIYDIKKLYSTKIAEEYFTRNIVINDKQYPHSCCPEKKIKTVLHVNKNDSKGGAAVIVNTLHNFFKRNSILSKCLVQDKFGNDSETFTISRHETITQKILSRYQKRSGYLDRFLLSSFDIKNYTEFQHADIIHFHNLHDNYFNIFALPELTALKPSIWTLHDMYPITGHCANSFECDNWQNGCVKCHDLGIYCKIKKDRSMENLLSKKSIYSNSDITITVPSLWLKKKVEKSVLHNHDIRLIYNGINENVFSKKDKYLSRSRLSLPQDKVLLLFIAEGGSKNPWKGGNYWQQACDDLNLKYKDKLAFIELGCIENNHTDNLIKRKFSNNNFEISCYYSAADIFIYPTIADNCPLVVLESQACQTPVVTFNTGGVNELIEHEETGYIANYKDYNDLLAGIEKYINDANLRNMTGMAGRQRILKYFTASDMAANFLNLYDEVLQKRAVTCK